MPIFSNLGFTLAGSGSEITSSFPILPIYYSSPNYGSLTPAATVGTLEAIVTNYDNTGSYGELIFRAPSFENRASTGSKILSISATGSNDEPRVGIGFEDNEKPIKAFDIKSKIESSKGTEVLIRSSRQTIGGQDGDEAGSINFVIDTGSFIDITTTGSAAKIKAIAKEVSAAEGVNGMLQLDISRGTTVDINMMSMFYNDAGSGDATYPNLYVTTTSHSFEIQDLNIQSDPQDNASFVHGNGINPYTIIRTDNPTTGNQGGLIQVNNKFGTGTIHLHGPTGEITASLVKADDLVLNNSLQYNNVILESTESAVSAGITTLGEFPTASYKSVHVDYLISAGSTKARAGHLISTWKGTDVTFTDVSAKSIGDTSDAEFSVVLNGANADLKISSSNSYDVSISSRAILNGSSFALGGGNISTSPFPFTGSAIITGSLDITGSIVPGGDGVYDLGDATHFWRTASIEHIVTLGDTIEFRDPVNKNTNRGTLKLDEQGGLKVRGSNNALTIISASHGHFTGNLAISGISNVSASIAAAAASGGDSSNRLAPSDTGSLLTTASVSSNIITFTKGDASTFGLTIDTGSTVIPSTYFNSSLLTTENISKNFSYTSSLNVAEITSSVEGAIIDYRLTRLDSGSRVGTFMYAHDGTTLSYNDITIPGAGLGDEPTLSATLTGSIVSLDIENAAGFNFSGFAKKFSKLDSAVPVADPNVTYLLDISPSENALAAYSVRQLSQFYTGSAMRIRRTSDNVELDIDYDINGELDTGAIETHCGSSSGRVTMWYDQSGNNNHISESNASLQPIIWNGTTMYTAGDNNKPALYPQGAFPLTTQNITPEGMTIVTENGNTHDVLIGGSNYADKLATRGNKDIFSLEGAGNNLSIPLSPYGGYRTYHLLSIQKDTYWGGETNANSRTTGTATGDFTIQCLFARTPGGNSSLNDGVSQEFVFWENSQTNNLTNLKNNINNYYGIYDTGLLVDYPSASAAYSVRQLTTAFTSSMNIRRASDNTEQVIGFTSAGDLDTGSIEIFCNGTECYVDTWYDQSGNGNHAEQTNAANQPLIYSASAVITESGNPAIKFTKETNSTLSTLNYTSIPATRFYHIWVMNQPINQRFNWMIGTSYYRLETNGQMYLIKPNDFDNAYGDIGLTGYKLRSINRDSDSTATAYVDGTSSNAWTGLDASAFTFNKVDGNFVVAGTGYHVNIQEFIIYDSDQSSNRTGIETNINSYFNIY